MCTGGPSHGGVTELRGGGHQETSNTTCCPGAEAGLCPGLGSERARGGQGLLNHQASDPCLPRWLLMHLEQRKRPADPVGANLLLSVLSTSSQGLVDRAAPSATWKELETAGLATKSGFPNSVPFIQRAQLSGLGRRLSIFPIYECVSGQWGGPGNTPKQVSLATCRYV